MTDDAVSHEVKVENSDVAPEPELGPVETNAQQTVSLADLEDKSEGSHLGGPLDAVLSNLTGLFRERSWLPLAVVGILLVLFLLLPPVSLFSRIAGSRGYTALTVDEPSLSHDDGLTVTLGEEQKGKLRVKVASLPRADFVNGEVDEDTRAAREAIPSHLTPKSPFYSVNVRGVLEQDARLTVDIPNEAEPWETLDLYAWDGERWQWLSNRLNRTAEVLEAELRELPSAVMVMQTEQAATAIIAPAPDIPPADYHDVLNGVDLVGIKIGTQGGVNGDATLLPPGSISSNPALAPVIRNWVSGRVPNRMLVVDMLGDEAARAAHVQNLVELGSSGGYPGIVLDYRNLSVEDRDAYCAFVEELAAALHAEDMWLGVTIDTPQKTTEGWETTGYDLSTLGAIADQIRIYMPHNPQVYAPGGQAESLLLWASSQVDRSKLYPVITTLSTNGEEFVTLDTVLGSVGEVQVAEGAAENGADVAPGETLNFQLGKGGKVTTDAASGATQLKVGETTYWLGTPQWLRQRLTLVNRYKVGGVVLDDLLSEGNFPGLREALTAYLAEEPVGTYSPPDVVWQVTGPNGAAEIEKSTLAQPQFSWVVPEDPGVYEITARVAGLAKGALSFEVPEPEAEEPTDEEVADDEEDDEETTETADVQTSEGLAATFVTDVTIPDNSQLDKGEAFEKTWRFRNSGDSDWPEETKLIFIQGDQMTDATEVEVGSVETGASVDITASLTAPETDGSYQGQWMLSVGDESISGGLAYVLIRVGDVAEEEPVAEEPPAAVQPAPDDGAFELGAHIMQGFKYADTMHYAGMNWAKIQVRWQNDPAGDIAAAHANGFKIQVSALGPASMAAEPGFEDRVAQWVAGMAAAGADAIEIWNEPNLAREWASGHISPEAYTQLLCKSYAAIKAANPNTAVISAAPAPTGYFGGCHPHGCDDIPWLQRMYNAGAANCMDYIGAHHNSGATPPAASSGHPADGGDGHHSWYFLPQTQAYYNIFGGTRKLFYTELGYVSPEGYGSIPAGFGDWGSGTTVAQQAQWLAEVVDLSRRTGTVQVVIVWNVGATCYGTCGGVPDPQAGYNIIRPDGSCPACDTLHALLGSR